MPALVEFIAKHGYALVFVWLLVEQIGIPVPAAPLLLTAGAVAGDGILNVYGLLAAALCGSLASDFGWYEVGRRQGMRVLKKLCRVSLEPDSCVKKTQNIFIKYGAKSLLVAKFIPGFNTISTPLAGAAKVSLPRFLLFTGGGAVLYVGVWLLIGFLGHKQFTLIAHRAESTGRWFGICFGLLIFGWIAYKYYHRRRFFRELRVARISPRELWVQIQSGDNPVVLDLRSEFEYDSLPLKVPGAIRLIPEDLDDKHPHVPRDRWIILYCSCPSEATSARAALQLIRRGIKKVRPLAGGLDGWIASGLPVEGEHSIFVPGTEM